MRQVVIDGYPFKRYRWEDGKYGEPDYKSLKRFLISRYGVCYFCGITVKEYPHIDSVNRWQPDDMATIDHLKPRQRRKKHEVVEKVLACYRCNHDRNVKEQSLQAG